MTQPFRRRFLAAFLALASFAHVNVVRADDAKSYTAAATGQIVAQTSCGAALVCQTAIVSGEASRLGPFVGELRETVDLTTGQYTGTAVFTFRSGDSLNTKYTGQVVSEEAGVVTFIEDHAIVSGTGRLSGTTGTLDVFGTADPALNLAITGGGMLFR